MFAPPFPAVWLLNFLLPGTLTFLFTKPFCRVREEQDHHSVSRSSISLYAFFGEAVNFKVGFYIYCIISILEMPGVILIVACEPLTQALYFTTPETPSRAFGRDSDTIHVGVCNPTGTEDATPN